MSRETNAAPRSVPCPKCKTPGHLVVPLKDLSKGNALYGCPACGETYNPDGSSFIGSAEELRDVFRGGTMTGGIVEEFSKTADVNPAQHAYLVARILEYGLQMYYDGLKQGLLLGAIQKTKENTDAASKSSHPQNG